MIGNQLHVEVSLDKIVSLKLLPVLHQYFVCMCVRLPLLPACKVATATSL